MQTRFVKIILALVSASIIAGCGTSSGIGKLFSKGYNDAGPDEFAILPTKALEMPEDLVNLPEPNLGGPNLVDPKPQHDAVAALGGRPELLDSPNIQSGEASLLAAATRNGITADIRGILRREDEKFRKENGPKFFERLFKTDVYFRRYESQTLAAQNELQRMRRIGARTPTSPPQGEN